MSQQPLSPPPQHGKDPAQDRWLYLLWKRISAAGQILWSQISFTGSNITDIEARNHADLQNLNTASYTHLTDTQATDLTDGGETTLHTHAVMTGDSGSGGVKGLVPAPDAGDAAAGKYLKADGTWATAGGSGGAISNVIASATTIDADTSYIVLSYLTVNDALTVNGNIGVI